MLADPPSASPPLPDGGCRGHAPRHRGCRLASAGPAGVAAAAPAPTLYVQNGPSITSYPLPSTGNTSPSSTLTATFDLPATSTMDAAGDLWTTSFDGSTLDEFTPAQLAAGGAQSPAVVISSSSLFGPASLLFTPSGDLWVSNFQAHTLNMFTPSQLAHSGAPVPSVVISATGSSLEEPFRPGLRPGRQPVGDVVPQRPDGRVHPLAAGPFGSSGARQHHHQCGTRGPPGPVVRQCRGRLGGQRQREHAHRVHGLAAGGGWGPGPAGHGGLRRIRCVGQPQHPLPDWL